MRIPTDPVPLAQLLSELSSPDKGTRIGALINLGYFRRAGERHAYPPLEKLTPEEQAAIFEAAAPLAQKDDDHEAALAIEAIGWFELPGVSELLASLTTANSPRMVQEAVHFLADKPNAALGLEAASRLIQRETFRDIGWSAADPSVIATSLVKYLEHPCPEVVSECRRVLADFASRLTELVGQTDEAGSALYQWHQINLMDNALMHILEAEWTLEDETRGSLYDRILRDRILGIAPAIVLCDIYRRTDAVPEAWTARLQQDKSLRWSVISHADLRVSWRRETHCDFGPMVSMLIRLLADDMKRCHPSDFDTLIRLCQATGRLDELHEMELPVEAVAARMTLYWHKTKLTPARALQTFQKDGLLEGVSETKLAKLKRTRLSPGGPLEWLHSVLDVAKRLCCIDIEAPESPPDYRPVFQQFSKISGGFLTMKGFAQRELDESIQLTCMAGGEPLVMEVPYEGDWIVLPSILQALNNRLLASGNTGRFIHFASDGQMLSFVFAAEAAWQRASVSLGLPPQAQVD